MSNWTDERIDLLKKLWADGLSAAQIAKQMGRVSRNAVLGKAHRLGLGGRDAPSAPQTVKRVLPPRAGAAGLAHAKARAANAPKKASPEARNLRQHNGAANRTRAKIERPKNPMPPHVLGEGHSPTPKPPTVVEMPMGGWGQPRRDADGARRPSMPLAARQDAGPGPPVLRRAAGRGTGHYPAGVLRRAHGTGPPARPAQEEGGRG
ncbi:GcrA family cell cycle regulator [Phenylobacterium sp. J426]|nr:GcrA family cell cycle regulator [Phenylobacterium sp. J426]MCR5875143.1 GcrA family cell cycle regulator [Phenylobacterium sp. J426]